MVKKQGLVAKVNTAAAAQAAAKQKPKAEHFKQEQSNACIEFDSLSAKIKTLDDLLAHAKVDLAVWEVERFVANKWDMGSKFPDGTTARTPLFQIKAWLKRKQGLSPAEFRQNLVDEMRKAAPRFKVARLPRQPDIDLVYEVSIFDHHVGKLCWQPETGNDYDLKIAGTDYMAAVEGLLARVQAFPLGRILFPIGNDFLHVDNGRGTTTNGTPQDCDGRWQLQFRHARRMLVSAIDRLREVAPVDVVVVPGNHDRERMFYLGDSVESWFHKDSRTAFDNRPRLRKYKQYGSVLLGFTHGCDEKHADLPRLMADEAPDLWAQTTHREFHLGHLHQRRKLQFVSTNTIGQTVVRILPSLSGIDAWHFSKGYNALPASEAYLWSAEQGYVGHFSHSPQRKAAA